MEVFLYGTEIGSKRGVIAMFRPEVVLPATSGQGLRFGSGLGYPGGVFEGGHGKKNRHFGSRRGVDPRRGCADQKLRLTKSRSLGGIGRCLTNSAIGTVNSYLF